MPVPPNDVPTIEGHEVLRILFQAEAKSLPGLLDGILRQHALATLWTDQDPRRQRASLLVDDLDFEHGGRRLRQRSCKKDNTQATDGQSSDHDFAPNVKRPRRLKTNIPPLSKQASPADLGVE